jgi:hypothetical protein
MTEILAFMASGCGIVMGIAPLLQTRQIIAFRITEGISIVYPSIIVGGAAVWVLYGLALDNWFIVIPNAFGVLSAGSVVGAFLYFRRRSS